MNYLFIVSLCDNHPQYRVESDERRREKKFDLSVQDGVILVHEFHHAVEPLKSSEVTGPLLNELLDYEVQHFTLTILSSDPTHQLLQGRFFPLVQVQFNDQCIQRFNQSPYPPELSFLAHQLEHLEGLMVGYVVDVLRLRFVICKC